MIGRGEKKRAAHFLQTLGDLLRGEIDLDAHRFQDVGTAGTLGDAPVAVFHHRNAHRAEDEHQPGGDIEHI